MSMLRVAEHAERTDTGRQRRANEDAFLARAPLFAVADGMGGAQAGEVAAQLAVETLAQGLPSGSGTVEQRLGQAAREANARIHQLSRTDDARAGMGTTLTALHVGEGDITIVHVGDSRCYRLRDGVFERLTSDHSLVEELVRQGRLSPEEAEDHPQRSIITRALGPELDVEPDGQTLRGRSGDVYLLCSDGLTSMVPEVEVGELVAGATSLRDAALRLIDAANTAGGRDNITVVLLRLEEIDGDAQAQAAAEHEATVIGVPPVRPQDDEAAAAAQAGPVERRAPEPPRERGRRRRRRGWRPGFGFALIVAVLVTLMAGAYLASLAVYFVGTGNGGFVTLYRGVPVELPGGVGLYQEVYVSGVSGAQLTPAQRKVVSSHNLRSRKDSDDYLRQLELGSLGP
ncbi:MAG: Stp1/IreP family PP2C-type Ser/Thr phosphatase [Actinobacteria bacterium]|nr:Stp1/IreP family PP2C-type Ser/Thr phosphatase [Actinomycetota bacterium]